MRACAYVQKPITSIYPNDICRSRCQFFGVSLVFFFLLLLVFIFIFVDIVLVVVGGGGGGDGGGIDTFFQHYLNFEKTVIPLETIAGIKNRKCKRIQIDKCVR